MGKQISRTPKQSDTGILHFLFENIDNGIQIGRTLTEVAAFRSYIGIVKTKIRHIQSRKHLKGYIGL